MIILVEINVKGFLWKYAKKTSIYCQYHKVAISERYWTLLTKQKLSGVISILGMICTWVKDFLKALFVAF